MEVRDKDLYEYILNLADDKTTINMIRANPKVFENERFYEKVMRKRYPLLIKFRKENETWKALYLRMVYILAKLEEDYKIPYIPTKDCSPELLLDSGKQGGKIYDYALGCAAAGGHIHLIDYFFERSNNKNSALAFALSLAGEYSNLNTVKYLISKGADSYHFLLSGAAAGGNVDVMKFALDVLKSRGWDFNMQRPHSAIRNAIANEKIEAIDFLIQNGLRIRREDIDYAEDKRNHDIAEYIRKFL